MAKNDTIGKYDKEIIETNEKIIMMTIMHKEIIDEEMKIKSKLGLFAS